MINTIVMASQQLYLRGWVPATSGNFSMRLDGERVAITVSGKDKSLLKPDDILTVDLQGNPLEGKKPSAETLLHVQLYQRDKYIGAVLHTHSIMATVVSMQVGDQLVFSGLELLKAFHGVDSHEVVIAIPIFENTQDMKALSAQVESHMQTQGQGYAYLIRGHGLYTWGADMAECMRHLEALEFLLEYHHRTE